MADHCNQCVEESFPSTARCPKNGKRYKSVSQQTLLFHVKKPWSREISNQGFYFCTSKDCDVVYFGEDGTTYSLDEVRENIGQKSSLVNRVMCYCFDVTYENLTKGKSTTPHHDSVKQYIVDQTKSGNCACKIKNPSGRCCLNDISKEGF